MYVCIYIYCRLSFQLSSGNINKYTNNNDVYIVNIANNINTITSINITNNGQPTRSSLAVHHAGSPAHLGSA